MKRVLDPLVDATSFILENRGAAMNTNPWLGILGLAFLSGCSPNSGSGRGDAIGTARLSIERVPEGVECLRVTVAGSSPVERRFAVSAGQSSNLLLKDLPLGEDV